MKFTLQKVVKVPVGGRKEDEYHYLSEDGKHFTQFHAGKRAWTWIITGGNMTLLNSDELVNEFCMQGLNGPQEKKFEDRVRELTIKLKE